MMNRWRRRTVLLIAVLAMLTSCGSGDGASDAAAPETSTTEPVTSSSTTPAPSSTSTTIGTTTSTSTTTTTTTIAPALDIDPSGEDVVSVFRELDAAYEYLTEFPDAADPTRFFEERGGAGTLVFMAERGFAREAARAGDDRGLVEVSVQGWSSEDFVQLFVVDSRDETGRQIVDADGNTRWEDHGWDEPQRSWVVEMRRGEDGWRIVERTRVFGRDDLPPEHARFHTPRLIPPVEETSQFTSGSAVAPDGVELAWEGHSYRDAKTDDHCVEIRLPEESRTVVCISSSTAATMTDNVAYQWGVMREREMGWLLGFGPNLPVEVGVDFGTSGVVGLRPARSGNIGTFATLESTWVEEATLHFQGRFLGGDVMLGSYACNEWSAGGGVEPTVMFRYAQDGGSRKTSVDELETYVLQHVHDWYAAPEVSISREEPGTFDAELFAPVSDGAQWFVVTVSDWDEGVGDTSRTWAMVLQEDSDGWYLADGRFREDCPG